MSELRIAQMLDDQNAGIDPFTQARNQYDKGLATPPSESIMFNPMFQPNPNPTAPSANTNSPTMDNMFAPVNQAQRNDFENTKLPKFLQKLGVDDKGLALNDVGRTQLLGRLQKKFGDNFRQTQQATDALAMFDENMKQFKLDNQKSYNQILSTGERTLAALFGGR